MPLVLLMLPFAGTPGHLTRVVCFKVHFPQCVSMICGPAAANVVTANKSCNVSQRFLLHFPTGVCVQFSLEKSGCEY